MPPFAMAAVIMRRHLSHALSNGGLEDFPCIRPRLHLKAAAFTGKRRKRQGHSKKKSLCRLLQSFQVQPQTHACKGAVAGIGKGLGKILASVNIAVVAFNGIFPCLINTVTVKLKLLIILRELPYIFQGRHDLKGRAGRIQPLGSPV